MVSKHNQVYSFLRSNSHLVMTLFISIFFITDALNALEKHHLTFFSYFIITPHMKLSSYSKGVVLVVLMLLYLIFSRNRSILLFVIVIGIVSFYFSCCYVDFYSATYWLAWFAKISFGFVLFIFLKDFGGKRFNIVVNTIRIVIIAQLAFVIIGAVTQYDLFLTYGHNRFGYKGLFYAQNEATFFYVIVGIFEFFRWQKDKRKIDFVLLIGILIASILLGAKAGLIFVGSALLYFIFFIKFNNKYFIITSLGIVLIIFSIALFYLGYFDFFIDGVNTKGWLYMITSKRNELVGRLPDYLDNWEILNYLFGGRNSVFYFVEMDVIDMFLFGGIIGSMVFYIVLFKTLFKFSRKNKLGWFLVSQYFLIGGLAGHVFASGINAIYLAILCYCLQRNNNETSNEINKIEVHLAANSG